MNSGETVKNRDQGKKSNEGHAFESVIGPSGTSLFDWNEILRYRELFYFFAWRDIKIKYKQTVLGFLWVVLQPLLMMVIFTLFFGQALKIPSQNLPYPVYVFSGLLLWNFFSSGLTSSSNSMISNASIIKKIYFPRLIVPFSSILVALFDFFASLVIYFAILLYYRQDVSWHWIWAWPASLIITIFSTLGLGCWLAALNVKYRDFRYVIPFFVQVLFFITPVIYPTSILPSNGLIYVLAASPMYAGVEFFRYPLTGTLPGPAVLVSLLSCVVLVVLGVLYFRRSEDGFVDLS